MFIIVFQVVYTLHQLIVVAISVYKSHHPANIGIVFVYGPQARQYKHTIAQIFDMDFQLNSCKPHTFHKAITALFEHL